MPDFRGNPPTPPPFWSLPDPGGGSASFGPAAGIAGAAGFVPPPPPSVTVYPWWLYQWKLATSWSIPTNSNALNFTAALNATTAVPNGVGQFRYTCPQGNRAVIKTVWATVQNSTAAMLLSWTLLRNGAPIQGWINVYFPPVATTALIIPFNGVDIELDEGETLTAQFTETSGANWVCSMQATGWQIGKREIERVQQGFEY